MEKFLQTIRFIYRLYNYVQLQASVSYTLVHAQIINFLLTSQGEQEYSHNVTLQLCA